MTPFVLIEWGLAAGMAIALLGVGVAFALEAILYVVRKAMERTMEQVFGDIDETPET